MFTQLGAVVFSFLSFNILGSLCSSSSHQFVMEEKCHANSDRIRSIVTRFQPELDEFEDFYRDIHRNAELSEVEERTAAVVADRLEQLNFTVHRGIGGHGVAGVLENGNGKVVLLRAELDALPIKEQTGLTFSSTKRMIDSWGQERPVMHACGHDLHMATLLASLSLLQKAKSEWSGTIVVVFQPNEEHLGGAQAMIDDGLYDKVPVPDVAFAQHGMQTKSGTLSVKAGPVLVSADTVQIRMFATFGLKANPQIAADPIRTIAKVINQLDDLIAETSNGRFAAIRIDEIHAGYPGLDWVDHVDLSCDIKTFDQDLRKRLYEGLRSLVLKESRDSGAKKDPEITIAERAQLTVNDDTTTNNLKALFSDHFGSHNVLEELPAHPVEDFSKLATAHSVPSVFWWMGRADPKLVDEAKEKKQVEELIPIEHSPFNAPLVRPTMKTGMDAMSLAALSYLANL